MAKLLINDSNKVLVGSNGKAYAVRNLDVLKGSTSPVDFTAAAGKLLRLMRYGKCEQGGTPTPSTPVDIVCNNGALRYGALGNNLFDPSPSCFKLNYYIVANNGTEAYSRTNFIYTPHIPVTPGTSYVFYGRKKSGNTISQYNRLTFYTADGTYLSTGTYTAGTIGKGTAPANAAYCILSCNPSGEASATGTQITQEFIDSYNWMFAEGTAEITPFVPFEGGIYTDGTPEVLTLGAQTVNVPMLLSVGTYKDEAEIIGGLLTHKVAIKVLDGTESGWVLSDSGSTHRFRGTTPSDCYRPTTRAQTVCTHFTFALTGSSWGGMFISTRYWYFIPTNQTIDTVDKWKAWLAAQYAAGTPVIVIYPLAAETTENVTPQPLNTVAGQNTLTDTANVSNPEYNLIYKI